MPTLVVVVGAPKRMHAIGPQRHVRGRVGGGAPKRRLKCDRAAFDLRVVADLHVPTRTAGVAAHGAAIFLAAS